MHRSQPADISRRIPSLTVAVAAAATVAVGLFLAAPAQAQAQAGQLSRGAQPGRVSVVIDSMTPQTAQPGATVTVTGTVSNGTGQTEAGLEVDLWTSAARFESRDAMDQYVSHGIGVRLEEVSNPLVLAVLKPGDTVGWRAAFQVDAAGLTQFGVYPVTAQLSDTANDVLGLDQTLLPFWPGQQAAGLARPLDIAWAWPLVDQPHHQVCSALTNNGLASSFAPGGRLAVLLAAGQAHPGADLTWVIDPALLSDAETMTQTYQVDSGPGCSEAVKEPASKPTRTWLSALRGVTFEQPTVILPYANVDVAGLVHNGMTADITSAYTMGYAVADNVLRGSFRPSIAVPAGGRASLSVLTNLATAQRFRTVVLDSNEMPPTNPGVFEDDAVTSVRTGDGLPMTVLLADHVLTGVLAAGDTSSGALPAGPQFAVSQRFLAETAMIAAEAPDSDRSVVVAPPEGWSPSAALAGELLSETAGAPWLTPTALGSLAKAQDSGRSIGRQQPTSKHRRGQLSPGYLSTVAGAGIALSAYKDLLYQASASYTQGLEEALTATESVAWRGRSQSQGLDLVRKLSAFMSGEESQIKIIVASQVPMGGSSGLVPVSIRNGSRHAVEVRLHASVLGLPDRTAHLSIGDFQDLVKVLAQQTALVRLPVSSAPIGPTAIQLSLTTVNRRALAGGPITFTVESTRYGRAILFLIGAAIGVLVLASVFRGVRRRLHADSQVVRTDADPPGSVVTGTSSARYPTEAPDDLADARRRADDA